MDMHAILAQGQADNEFKLRVKRPGVYQIIAPFFHEDGDMVNMFIEETETGQLRITDHGLSLMRLSYLFDLDTETKIKTLNNMVTARGADLNDGSIDLLTSPEMVVPCILSYAQLVSEVSSMEMLSRALISNLFYDQLKEALDSMSRLSQYVENYSPRGFPDVVADYAYLPKEKRPVLLFGVKDTNKAQQAALSCYELKLGHFQHKSIAVFEDFDIVAKNARNHLMNAAGKLYSNLSSFREDGEDYIRSELDIA